MPYIHNSKLALYFRRNDDCKFLRFHLITRNNVQWGHKNCEQALNLKTHKVSQMPVCDATMNICFSDDLETASTTEDGRFTERLSVFLYLYVSRDLQKKNCSRNTASREHHVGLSILGTRLNSNESDFTTFLFNPGNCI